VSLTLAEIEQLHISYLKDPGQPPSDQFARLLDRVQERIEAQIAEHQLMLRRIETFRAHNHG
jgi:DNA-binding transcriptional MerR regulator